jgi:beta-galactosidase GanA
MNVRFPLLAVVLPAVLAAAGCGGGKKASSTPATTQPTTTPASTSPGALQAEAASAATGDIPDNQIYLVYRSSAGWSIKYPEGWARSGGPNSTVFRDKNNIVRIVLRPGSAPTTAQVRNDPSLRQAHISSAPAATSIKGSRAIKVVYTTRSAPNAVTGKRVTLTVDRYYLERGGKVATIDLGTPVGVDNVDAYRLMIQSFRWR